MKTLAQIAVCLTIAVSAAACIGYERNNTPTSPSGGSGSLVGNWTSSSLIPTPSSCADFKWNITEQVGNTAKGSFSATCANDLKLTGTAQGTINGSTIEWSATAVGNAAGLANCQVSLKGHRGDRRDDRACAVLRRHLSREGERGRVAEPPLRSCQLPTANSQARS